MNEEQKCDSKYRDPLNSGRKDFNMKIEITMNRIEKLMANMYLASADFKTSVNELVEKYGGKKVDDDRFIIEMDTEKFGSILEKQARNISRAEIKPEDTKPSDKKDAPEPKPVVAEVKEETQKPAEDVNTDMPAEAEEKKEKKGDQYYYLVAKSTITGTTCVRVELVKEINGALRTIKVYTNAPTGSVHDINMVKWMRSQKIPGASREYRGNITATTMPKAVSEAKSLYDNYVKEFCTTAAPENPSDNKEPETEVNTKNKKKSK